MNVHERYEIRAITADEWPQVKELRLAALADPVAHLAFLETSEEAQARPEAFWKDRAARSADGAGSRQFVAVAEDGTWAGTATGFVEEPGALDFFGGPIEQRQVQVVGVFVRSGHRGSGLLAGLVHLVADWAHEKDIQRIRLYVHADNGRAVAAYEKLRFVGTGVRLPSADGGEELEYELRD